MELFIIGKKPPAAIELNLDDLIPLRIHWHHHFTKLTLADTHNKDYPPAAFYSLEDAKEILRKADNSLEEKMDMWIINLQSNSYIGMTQKELINHG